MGVQFPPAYRSAPASMAPGVALDCDIRAGTKVGGGMPTDNAAALNARLAGASPGAPASLVIDGGSAMAAPLVIPATGHVNVEGHGWSTGFYWLPGSNCSQIQTSNVGTTQAEHFDAVHPPGAQSIAGRNVRLANFHLNCGRGTFPNGLVSNTLTSDGTISMLGASGTPVATDARGIPSRYFYTSVLIIGIENLHIEGVSIYDSPSYAIDIYHCARVWIDRCRIEAADPVVVGNTDGIHVNGGCSDVLITDCWFSTGDDPIAFNVDEGDAQPGGNFVVRGITYANCKSGGRVDGRSVATRKVSFSDVRGTVQWWGLLIGNDVAPGAADMNHSVLMDGWCVNVTAPDQGGGLAFITANTGLLEMSRIKVVEPTVAHSFIQLGSTNSAPVASSVRVSGLELHRNASGSAAVPILTGTTGTIAELSIDGFRVTDNGSFSAIPYLINLTGSATIARLWIDSLDMNHVTAFCNDFSKIGSIAGPGCAGLALPDARMADGWPYLSANNSNAPAIKVGGVVKLFTIA